MLLKIRLNWKRPTEDCTNTLVVRVLDYQFIDGPYPIYSYRLDLGSFSWDGNILPVKNAVLDNNQLSVEFEDKELESFSLPVLSCEVVDSFPIPQRFRDADEP